MPLSIERARKDAKALNAAWKRKDPKALKRVRPYFEPDETAQLSKAQLVVAREQLYDSWTQLLHAGGVLQNDIVAAARLGDVGRVRALLEVLTPMRAAPVVICFNPLAGDEEDVVDCLRLLFAAGCDPNAGVLLKKVKHTCLFGAIEQGHERIAALLRELGAELHPNELSETR